MIRFGVILSIFAWAISSLMAQPASPKIQIALLLDTSNSMDGLIDQAKSELWRMVNEFALAEKDGRSPQIEIALYEYGNDGLPAGKGYLRRVLPLTSDLDALSEALFALTTNGGSEYCGWVIRAAVDSLHWSPTDSDLKIIFIAGNESFAQGEINYRESCRAAIRQGIIINTIFCGNGQDGIDLFWKEGAQLADGRYVSINQDQSVVHIPTPQDSLINRLSLELNKTYLGYGTRGKAFKERQERQDANAISYGTAVGANRAAVKASKSYHNASWDLVDAVEEEQVNLESLTDDQMPEELRGKTIEEKKQVLKKLREKRERIQAEIRKLDAERKRYLAEHRPARHGNTLDQALIGLVREQATAKSFYFPDQQ